MLVFSCPKCLNNDLRSSLEKSGKTDSLECTSCGTNYPIINEIPRLTDLTNYAESFGYQWNIFRKSQLDSYINKPISEVRIKDATGWSDLGAVEGNLLEAGSGAGRFTEILSKTNANIFSFDFSNAVEANYKNNGHFPRVRIFQGDIYNIPFEDQTFDHVFCLGVIQHTPNSEEAFKKLSKKVKPGGYLYIDHYALKWHHILQWKYLLRPLTKRMNQEKLFGIISFLAPIFIPLIKILKAILGKKVGSRILPIQEFSHLGLEKDINLQWAILDTFDMLSPEHDHPRTIETIKEWFDEIDFEEVNVFYGDNGIVGRAKRPL